MNRVQLEHGSMHSMIL
ncbi:MAG: hypothetical protein KH219_09010 [Peptoniphilus harei]|nr:hypothetical protein [Peptoniphilus harei]MBS6766373.1 hypothetical protein [Clostridium sp.]